VSALVPSLRTVFVVLVVLGALTLAAAASRGPGRATGSNEWAMMWRLPRGADPGEEAAKEYSRRHGLDQD
jgi:hypothetical protein